MDQLSELATALAAAQAEFTAVPKGNVNPFFKSKYASLADVISHTAPVLAKHGLAVVQFPDGNGLTTYVLHKSGQFLCGTMDLHPVKDDPQSQGSAITYARRYCYMAALGIVADEDDDGNAATKSVGVSSVKETPRGSTAPANNQADVAKIIDAAGMSDNKFLKDLAKQIGEGRTLSDKQMLSGLKQADTVLAKRNPVQELADILDGTEVFE